MKNYINKKWYISEMELWDNDYINEEVQGYFLFEENNQGEFHFGYVHGFMDCEYIKKDENTIVEFLWVGNDKNDLINGRGYAELENNNLIGKIYINNGDNSKFEAILNAN